MMKKDEMKWYTNKTYRFNFYAFTVFFLCIALVDILFIESWQKNILITLIVIFGSLLGVVSFLRYLLHTPNRVGISSDNICFEYKGFGRLHPTQKKCLKMSKIENINFSKAGDAVLSRLFVSINIQYLETEDGKKQYKEIKMGECHEKLAEKLRTRIEGEDN